MLITSVHSSQAIVVNIYHLLIDLLVANEH